jgi:hypothetical protein
VQAVELNLPARPNPTAADFECAWVKILEIRLSLDALGEETGEPIGIQVSLWRDGLPLDAVPQSGWLEMATTNPALWGM